MSNTPVLNQILSIGIDKNSKLSEIEGFDSLKFVRLILELEEKLDRELEREEIDQLTDLNSIEKILNLK